MNPLRRKGYFSIGVLLGSWSCTADILKCSRMNALLDANSKHLRMKEFYSSDGVLGLVDILDERKYATEILGIDSTRLGSRKCIVCKGGSIPIVKDSVDVPIHQQCFDKVIKVIPGNDNVVIKFIRVWIPDWVHEHVSNRCDQLAIVNELIFEFLRVIYLKANGKSECELPQMRLKYDTRPQRDLPKAENLRKELKAKLLDSGIFVTKHDWL